ncbi:putative short-chain dehydrogenase [Xylariaceae sp. FL1019]|nr:putative short-chain dehydrogenase [Xylariaceae sp. FL1019]
MSVVKSTIFLTGANGGLARAVIGRISVSPRLAQSHCIYAVRNDAAATALDETLRGMSEILPSYEVLKIDLSDVASVREGAAATNAKILSGEIPPIKALILCAGHREALGQTWTSSGLDASFASNYLGQWLLTMLLLRGIDREQGRVVVVGGWVHDPLDPRNRLNRAYTDDQWHQIITGDVTESVEAIAKGTWSASPTGSEPPDPRGLAGIRRYGAAKLCSVMMIIELQRRLDQDPKLSNISLLGVDPGIMPTSIATNGQSWVVKPVFSLVLRIVAWFSPNGALRSPYKSASDVLAAALQREPPIGDRPKALYLDGAVPKAMGVEAHDKVKRAAVWEASVKYAHLTRGETELADWE